MSMLHKKYRVVSKKGEGTFSEVVKCQSLEDGSYCAVKRMKGKFDSVEKVNNLREIQALRRLNPHPNIIALKDVVFDPQSKTLDLVCELMDMNIYERIRGRKHHLPDSLVKSYVYQLCKSLDHMHRNGIFHRDVKPENILIQDDVLKLADFGSCRGIYSKPPFTEYISTRWYRAPECLLTDGHYNFKMDMWSVGCVLFEIACLYPLFPGSNELDQISKIHDVLGTPTNELLTKIRKGSPHMNFKFPPKKGTGLKQLIPHASPECLDLLTNLLQYDPDLRLSARQALRHPYFKELRDADKKQKRLKAKQEAAAQEQEQEQEHDGVATPAEVATPASSTTTATTRRTHKPRSLKPQAVASTSTRRKAEQDQPEPVSQYKYGINAKQPSKSKQRHKPKRQPQANGAMQIQALPPIFLKSQQLQAKPERYGNGRKHQPSKLGTKPSLLPQI